MNHCILGRPYNCSFVQLPTSWIQSWLWVPSSPLGLSLWCCNMFAFVAVFIIWDTVSACKKKKKKVLLSCSWSPPVPMAGWCVLVWTKNIKNSILDKIGSCSVAAAHEKLKKLFILRCKINRSVRGSLLDTSSIGKGRIFAGSLNIVLYCVITYFRSCRSSWNIFWHSLIVYLVTSLLCDVHMRIHTIYNIQ